MLLVRSFLFFWPSFVTAYFFKAFFLLLIYWNKVEEILDELKTHFNVRCVGMLDVSLESGLSDDYAIPPDAVSCESVEWGAVSTRSQIGSAQLATLGGSPRSIRGPNDQIEKSGYLAKLGGKLKTWTRRWFHLNNTKLRYWKSQVQTFCFL